MRKVISLTRARDGKKIKFKVRPRMYFLPSNRYKDATFINCYHHGSWHVLESYEEIMMKIDGICKLCEAELASRDGGDICYLCIEEKTQKRIEKQIIRELFSEEKSQ